MNAQKSQWPYIVGSFFYLRAVGFGCCRIVLVGSVYSTYLFWYWGGRYVPFSKVGTDLDIKLNVSIPDVFSVKYKSFAITVNAISLERPYMVRSFY